MDEQGELIGSEPEGMPKINKAVRLRPDRRQEHQPSE